MKLPGNFEGFFEAPRTFVYLLVGLNLVIYALCVSNVSSDVVPVGVLFRNGAMYSAALARHEYWRLIAYGFLHTNLLHVATNMLCLALWGSHLERRIGSMYFIMVYVGSVVVGGLVSHFSQQGPYILVGASGGISGVLGALLCLRLLAKIDLAANFFIVNIGLNVALAATVSRISWSAHLGGFAAGLACCALLELFERSAPLWLRCQFPEFAKMNVLVIAGAIAIYWAAGSPDDPVAWVQVVGISLVTLVAIIKATDFALSVKKGLAIVVVAFAAGNGAAVLLLGQVATTSLAPTCATIARGASAPGNALVGALCASPVMSTALAAALAVALTLLLYTPELQRGLSDAGFISAGLMGERRRRRGI
jgi:membrane associated rhomboid family serine protease